MQIYRRHSLMILKRERALKRLWTVIENEEYQIESLDLFPLDVFHQRK